MFSLLSLLEAKVPHALPSFPVLRQFYATMGKRWGLGKRGPGLCVPARPSRRRRGGGI